jgi:AraC-like DNA-binding protein
MFSVDKPWTVAGMAEAANMSVFHFIRVFKHVFCESPLEFLTRQRISNVTRLLRTSDLAISEIAEQTGFSALSVLSRAFKREMGCSATEYRRHVAAGAAMIVNRDSYQGKGASMGSG